MQKLLKNVQIFRDGQWKPSELLIADKRIAAVGDKVDCAFDGLEVVDGNGMRAIPGYIDQHVHITGGGGEGGFANQVPPLKFSAPVKAGITTIVGLLGTDGTTRSVESLVAKAKAFREQGLTCFCLTGAQRNSLLHICQFIIKGICGCPHCRRQSSIIACRISR